MRDGRCVAFEALITVLLLKYLALEANLVHLLRHVLEVDRNGWTLKV